MKNEKSLSQKTNKLIHRKRRTGTQRFWYPASRDHAAPGKPRETASLLDPTSCVDGAYGSASSWRSSERCRPTSGSSSRDAPGLHLRQEQLVLTQLPPGAERPDQAASAAPPDASGAQASFHETNQDTIPYVAEQLLPWHELHTCVVVLPDEERQVFELLWYLELAPEEAAAVLQVPVATVKRRWLSARLHLQGALPAGGPSA